MRLLKVTRTKCGFSIDVIERLLGICRRGRIVNLQGRGLQKIPCPREQSPNVGIIAERSGGSLPHRGRDAI